METYSNKNFVLTAQIMRIYVLNSVSAEFYSVRENVAAYGVKVESAEPNYQFEDFPERLLRLWAGSKKIVVYQDDTQFNRFINDAMTIKSSKKEMFLGIIPDELAKR